MPGVVPWDGMPRHPGLEQHERLAAELRPEDRAWLARMADVLEPGVVVPGMAVPARGGVVTDARWPGGLRVVVPPSGGAGQARAR